MKEKKWQLLSDTEKVDYLHSQYKYSEIHLFPYVSFVITLVFIAASIWLPYMNYGEEAILSLAHRILEFSQYLMIGILLMFLVNIYMRIKKIKIDNKYEKIIGTRRDRDY